MGNLSPLQGQLLCLQMPQVTCTEKELGGRSGIIPLNHRIMEYLRLEGTLSLIPWAGSPSTRRMSKAWISPAAVTCDQGLLLFPPSSSGVEPHNCAWSSPHLSPPAAHAAQFAQTSSSSTLPAPSSSWRGDASWDWAGRETHGYTKPLISAELSQNYFDVLAFKLLPSVLTGAFLLISSAKRASSS